MFRLKSLIFPLAFLIACTGSNVQENKEVAKSDNGTTEQTSVQRKLTRDPRKIGPEKSQAQASIENNLEMITKNENPLCGFWVGKFGTNKINIALASIDNEKVIGHSVCAGNYREIKGTIKKLDENTYQFELNEPGDDAYDGKFNFIIDLSANKLEGKWVPFKKNTSEKTYQLDKKVFTYNPQAGDHPTTSVNYLEVSDVQNLLPEDAEYMRNEIYARHGYSFKNKKIRSMFDEKDWYIPVSVDVREDLSEIEAHNIDLLLNYEKYQEEYYDDFGR